MPDNNAILVVDDNESIYKSLSLNFKQRGFACFWAKNGADARNAITNAHIGVVLLDLSLGIENGIDVTQDLLALRPTLLIIFITGFGTFETAVKAIKLGTKDFLPKPLEFDKLYKTVRETLRLDLPSGPTSAASTLAIISQRKDFQALCKRAQQFAKTDIPILVTGESGTGKELLVSLIHNSSPRKELPFLRINCSAFAETLVDNELFGHEKGAFTGATQFHPGPFEQADQGTLHLDEIGDMSLATQAKILRVLEEGVVRRIGGMKDIAVDVRVIASTNKDLHDLIERNLFRSDLFYRLNAVMLHIPPLRERQDDIPLLVDHFLAEFAEDSQARTFSDSAIKLMKEYSWPGNIRELRNIVKACSLISESDLIEAEDLPDYVRMPSASRSTRLNVAEKTMIQRTLAESQGNKSLAAEKLGISRRTLYNKMERYGIV